MYKNVGRDIKRFATFMAGLYALCGGIIGFVLGSMLKESAAVAVLTVLCAVVGYLIGRFKRMKLYAYGEIACRLIWIDEKMEQLLENREKNILEGLRIEQQTPVSNVSSLYCVHCGTKNDPIAKCCVNCGCSLNQ